MTPFAQQRSEAFKQTLEGGAGELVLYSSTNRKVWALVKRGTPDAMKNPKELNFAQEDVSSIEVPFCEIASIKAPNAGQYFLDDYGKYHRIQGQSISTDISWISNCYISLGTPEETRR